MPAAIIARTDAAFTIQVEIPYNTSTPTARRSRSVTPS
jgi:hypothetical protein